MGPLDVGSGEVQPDVSGDPAPETDPTEEVVPPTEQSSSEAQDEPVMTQDDFETIETPPAEDKNKTENNEDNVPLETTTQKTTEKTEKTEKQEEIDPRLKNVLDNAFNKSGGSEGDDANKPGDKGKVDGDKKGNSYTGGKGGSGGGDFRLGNRNALDKVKPLYKCDEYGIVVMTVRVNRSGNTIDAKLQLKGTTNTAACLVNRAKEAALKTKWQPDPSAPEIQIGSITYHFELN